MKKANCMTDVYMALLEYRSIPTKDLSYSPSQLNQNLVLRSLIPTKLTKFEPELCSRAQQELENKQNNMKKFYDRTARDRNDFRLNDKMYVSVNDKWKLGIVSKLWHTPRSYIITTEDGEYRRNSRDLRARFNENEVNTQNEENVYSKQTRSGRIYG